MTTTPDYGPLLDDAELDQHIDTIGWSFRVPADTLRQSFDRVGREKIRVLRGADRIVGGLTLFPMGQWFGGRRVEMTGVNLVGIAPEHRGGGTATRLMAAAVREMRDAGTPISVLYPAKQTLYRRAGYELAGSRFENEIDLRDLGFGDRELNVRLLRPEDAAVVQDLYRSYASAHNGPLDRPAYMWQRVADPVGRDVRGYLVEGDAGAEGYVYVEEVPGEGYGYRLMLTDFAATTGRGARRLLRFLGDHASLGEAARWYGDPTDLAFLAMREQTWRTKVSFRWMLRVLDPTAALEQRGYARSLDTEVDLELADDLLPENNGRWRVQVAGGRAQVRPGGEGRVRADIRALASIYTGYLTPAKAQSMGLLDGDAESVARLREIFAGSTPWIPEMF